MKDSHPASYTHVCAASLLLQHEHGHERRGAARLCHRGECTCARVGMSHVGSYAPVSSSMPPLTPTLHSTHPYAIAEPRPYPRCMYTQPRTPPTHTHAHRSRAWC
jgi:hypothetical protein